MRGLNFDIAHLLAGSLVLVSFMQLYQDRLTALLHIFALHALMLALSVAWQAYVQDAPHLFVTAALALVFKAIVIPLTLHRIIMRLGIHREIETVGGIGLTMLAGIGLVALSMVVILRVTGGADSRDVPRPRGGQPTTGVTRLRAAPGAQHPGPSGAGRYAIR